MRELWARHHQGRKGIDRPGTGASGGSLAASDLARAGVTFTFNGTGVDWFTGARPAIGQSGDLCRRGARAHDRQLRAHADL